MAEPSVAKEEEEKAATAQQSPTAEKHSPTRPRDLHDRRRLLLLLLLPSQYL